MSLRKPFYFAAAGLLLVALSGFLPARGEVVDRIVAVVGKEVITQRELDAAYQQDLLGLMRSGPNQNQPRRKLSKEEYLEELINRKLIDQEVKRQGIKVDALEVEKAIDRKRDSLGLTEDQFERALALQGLTMDQYREEVRRQIITYRLISQEVRGDIEITDQEALSYYNQHQEQFVEKDRYHLYHIFIPFPLAGGTEAREQTVARLEQIRKQIKSGKTSFQEMAKAYSKSPTAARGGDLGWFHLNELLPAFRKQVEKLEPGEMSPVFVQGKGAHLLLLAEVEKGKPIPFEKVKDRIRDILYEKEAMEKYDIWLERLKAKTYIENRLKNPEPAVQKP